MGLAAIFSRSTASKDTTIPANLVAEASDLSDEHIRAPACPSDVAASTFIKRLNVRGLTPRQMAEACMDLYLFGLLTYDEYAVLAFQAELHPDYDRTIGALTERNAEPDRPRDYIHVLEEKLQFERTYDPRNKDQIRRIQNVLKVFRKIDSARNRLI
jgi:hypothetical protein